MKNNKKNKIRTTGTLLLTLVLMTSILAGCGTTKPSAGAESTAEATATTDPVLAAQAILANQINDAIPTPAVTEMPTSGVNTPKPTAKASTKAPAKTTEKATPTPAKKPDTQEYMAFISSTVETDNWVFFTQKDGIYRMRADGSEKTKIVSGKSDNFNTLQVAGDWLYFTAAGYYIDSEGGTSGYPFISRCRLDGSQMQNLNLHSFGATYYVDDQWIYYVAYDEYEKGFRKAKLDGSENQILYQFPNTGFRILDSFLFDDGNIYVFDLIANETTCRLCKIHVTDGNCTILKTTVRNFDISIDNGWIYYGYTDDSKITSLYRIKKDGSNDQTLFNNKTNKFYPIAVMDGVAYCFDENGISYFPVDNQSAKKSVELKNFDRLVGISKNWIYYRVKEDPYKESCHVCRIRLDGSGNQTIGEFS